MFRKLLAPITIIFFIFQSSAQIDFKITRENKKSDHELGINKYSFIHHVCPDSFFMTELYDGLDYDQMSIVLKDIYEGVTLKDQVQVVYSKVSPTTAKFTYWVKDHEENGKMFIMLTNFNNASRSFDKNPDSKDQLARWYFVKGDRLIYRKDLFSTEKEEFKLKSEKEYDIIKYYLFDDNAENDNQIKPMIDKIMSESENLMSKYFAQIYLVQYYLMNSDLQSAENSLVELKEYFKSNYTISQNNKIYLKMVTAEFEMMKRM
jgi:hypothetical protein